MFKNNIIFKETRELKTSKLSCRLNDKIQNFLRTKDQKKDKKQLLFQTIKQ